VETFEVKTATAYGKTLYQSKILQMRKRRRPTAFTTGLYKLVLSLSKDPACPAPNGRYLVRG